jgi:hypothetical protein
MSYFDQLIDLLHANHVSKPIIALYEKELCQSELVSQAAFDFYSGEVPSIKVEGVSFADLIVKYKFSSQGALVMLALLERNPSSAFQVLKKHDQVKFSLQAMHGKPQLDH